MSATISEFGSGIYAVEVIGVFAVNAGIVVGDDGAVVVDSGTTESDAEVILDAVRRVTDKPLNYVINTHYHGDHSFGNWWLRPAIAVGHNRCRVRLLGEAGEAHRDAFARMMPQAADQISAVTVDPPSVTFEERMALHLGNVSLELQYFGRAHTDNDITITVVDTGHCFAGDLIEESGPPVALESFPRDWGASIRALVGSGATSYIPGHGRAVPGDHALRLPNELTAEEAAPLLCAGLTVYAGLKNANLRPGRRLAVLGIGGLGHLAIPIARAMGASVVAVTTSADKADTAHELGAEAVVGGEDAAKQLREMGGADIVLNTVDAPEPLMSVLGGMRPQSTVLLVTTSIGDVLPIPTGLLMGLQMRIVTSFFGSRQDLSELLDLAVEHKIRPIVETYALEDVNEAHERLRANEVRFRAVLTP